MLVTGKRSPEARQVGMGVVRELRSAALEVAPTLTAALTLAAGVMLLVSGATPSDPERFRFIAQVAPLYLIEISHFLSSILGLVLVLLAFGLRRRLDAAWGATVAVLALAAVLALLKGFNWPETTALALLWLLILPLHPAFPRTSRLTRMEITPGWLISALAAVIGAAALGWWSFRHADYSDTLWWKVMADADATRSLRASAGAAILLLAVGLWRMLATPATPPIVGDDDPQFDKVRAILASAEDPEPSANLALLGDKRFLFSQSGESFLMFGVRGRSWISLGPPVGKREERMELLWRFRELADAHAARPALYGIGPDVLPDVVELGFSIQKTGELATVPLDQFSLQGRRRDVLRRNWRKAGEGGACFEVLTAEAARREMGELSGSPTPGSRTMPAATRSSRMGGFEPRYVSEFPCAVVRSDGRIVAFATIWTTGDHLGLFHGPDALRRRRAQERDGFPVRRADQLGPARGLHGVRVRHGPARRAGRSSLGPDHVAGGTAALRARRGPVQFPRRAPLQGQVRPDLAAALYRRAAQVGDPHPARRCGAVVLRRRVRPDQTAAPRGGAFAAGQRRPGRRRLGPPQPSGKS